MSTTPPSISLVVQTLRTHNALMRASRRLFRPHGLSEAQFNVLYVLQDAGDALTQSKLSDILVVDRSNVTGLIDRMEQSGWVRRTPVPNDRRAYRIVLTAAGRKLWRTVNPIYAAAAAQVASTISPTQLETAMRVLTAMETQANGLD